MTDQPAAPALAPDVLDQLRAALPEKVFRPLLPSEEAAQSRISQRHLGHD